MASTTGNDGVGTVELYAAQALPPEIRRKAEHYRTTMEKDPFFAALIGNWLNDLGVPTAEDPAYDSVSAALHIKSVPYVHRQMIDAFAELSGVTVLMGLSVWGIFDPSPTVDGAATVAALTMTRYSAAYYVDALLSAVSMFPYVGDALAKPLLGARLADRTAKLLNTVEALLETIRANARIAGFRVKLQLETLLRTRLGARALGNAGRIAAIRHVPSTGSKMLDQVLNLLGTQPYQKLAQLKPYLEKRGCGLIWGDKGADMIDQLERRYGSPGGASGLFWVLPDQDSPSGVLQVLVFRGQPSRVDVHHELWHRQDFVRNHGGDIERWTNSRNVTREAYVHQRMTGSRRWTSYAEGDRFGQESSFFRSVSDDPRLLTDLLASYGLRGSPGR